MITNSMNQNARDSRIAGGPAGLGKSRDALDEQVFLSLIKINGKPHIGTHARVFITECAKLSVHRVIFLTGGGFKSNSYLLRNCSSRGKAALHEATYKRQSLFHGNEVKND